MKQGRPRTVASPDLPKGVRKVGERYYWRGTTEATRAIQRSLSERGVKLFCGLTVKDCWAWHREHVGQA